MIEVGRSAPDFVLSDHENTHFRLSDFRGRHVLLIFYPHDNGLVCTRQLCNYRDNWEAFVQRNIVVLGLNPSSRESHREFAAKFKFPFPLLVDERRAVAEAYGAIGLLGLSTRAYVLINPDGRVIYSTKELTIITRQSTYKLMSIFDALQSEQNS